MRTKAHLLNITALLALTGGAAAADIDPNPAEAYRISVAGAPPRAPIENVLDDMRVRGGYSFVYDSRVIEGKTIHPVYWSASPEKALETRLADIGLTLHKTGPRSYAIAQASGGGALIAPASMVAAAPQAFGDVIFVTATAGPVAGALSSGRLIDIGPDDLALISGATPGEALHDLPQSIATFTPSGSALYESAAGLDFVDLRGIGTDHSIVLVNGRHATPTFGGAGTIFAPDIGRFVSPFLERIEVDTTSGGARYGGGAVAGVVNFVTRSGLQGFEAGVDAGVSERGDNKELSLHVVGGGDVLGGAGNITGGVNVMRTTGLVGADRDALSQMYGFTSDGAGGYSFLPGYGGSPLTQRGLIVGAVTGAGEVALFSGGAGYVPQPGGAPAPFTGALDQLSQPLADITVVPAVERVVGYLNFSADISSELRLFGEMHGGVVSTENQLAAVPGTYTRGIDPVGGDATVVPLDYPTLPDEVRQLIIDEFGPDAQSVVMNRRWMEFGPRRDTINRQFLELVAGAEVGDKEHISYTFAYRFGHTHVSYVQRDRISGQRLKIAFDPDACAETAGCALLDLFGPSGISDAARNFLTIPRSEYIYNYSEHTVSARADAKLKGVLADDVSAYIGAAFSHSSFKGEGRAPEITTTIGVGLSRDSGGSLDKADITAGFVLPFWRSAGAAGEFDVTTDARLTISSVYDLAHNLEVGGEWRPQGGVRVFSHHLFGRRTPNPVELYFIDGGYYEAIGDPCDNYETKSAQIAENCASDTRFGVEPGFSQGGLLIEWALTGNPSLKSENVRSDTIGLAVRPSDLFPQMPGAMELSASWSSYRVANLINVAENILSDCYESAGFSNVGCGVNPITGGPVFERDPDTGRISSVDELLQNLGEGIRWRGLDVELRYVLTPARGGFIDRVWLSAVHTYTDRVLFIDRYGNESRLEGFKQHARHETIIKAGLEGGGVTLASSLTRRGRVRTEDIDIPEVNIPAVFNADVSARYSFGDRAYVQLAVENLLDRDPPIAGLIYANNTLPNYYDVIGRRFTLSTRVRF